MVQIEKVQQGRIIKIKKIKMTSKDYLDIKDILMRNTIHDAEKIVTETYGLATLTEGYKVAMAVKFDYKYLEVV